MAITTRLRLGVEQRLAMTPSLQQAIALLQKSRAELVEEIRRELQENPVFDAEETGNVLPRAGADEAISAGEARRGEAADEPEDEAQFEALWRASREDFAAGRGEAEDREAPDYESFTPRQETLAEHLLWQLEVSAPTPRLEQIGALIIGNLDEAGYLGSPLEELRAMAGASEPEVLAALALVQGFDPAGVAARDLRECLLIQAASFGHEDGALLSRIIRHHLDKVKARRLDEIAAAEGCSLAEVEEACESLRHFAPKPGLQYSVAPNPLAVPDVYLQSAKGGGYRVALNEEGLPRLRVSHAYERMFAEGGGEVKEYLREKFQRARDLIRGVQQRQRTLHRVAESIVRRQKDFFEHGPAFLRPLTLAEVARDARLHPSTVSRAVRGKYLQCPRGVLELRFFFQAPAAPARDGGQGHSSLRVKERIRSLVEAEDASRPLSDEALTRALKQEGMALARRTVAKYREEAGIPDSRLRRKRQPPPSKK